MENTGHSCRIHPDFAHISGNVRPNVALCKIWGPDQIQSACAIWDAPIGGRARAKAGDFRAGGHDMYEKAGTYVKFSKFQENVCY